MIRIFFVLLFVFLANNIYAQKKQLTDEHYFGSALERIVKPLPFAIRFEDDNHLLVFQNRKYARINVKSGKMINDNVTVPAGDVPKVADNDIYYKNERLTFDKDQEVNPTLSPDSQYIAYTKNNNLYTLHIPTKKETQLTFDGSELILNGYASWVYMEEILGRSSQYRAFWWSPDSKSIAFFRSDDSEVPEYVLTDDDGQTTNYVEKLRYPKPGDKNPEIRVGIVGANGGAIVWSDFNEKDDQYFGAPFWKKNGEGLLVQWMNRAQNELKIYDVNPTNGSKKLFYEEKSSTWIDLGDEGTRITILPNNLGYMILSDESGSMQMYLHDLTGKRKHAITSKDLMVQSVLDVDKNGIYFTAKKRTNSTSIQIFHIDLQGKKLQQLSNDAYSYSNVKISPNKSYIAYTYGNAQTPNKLAVRPIKGKELVLFDSKTEAFDEYDLALPELFRVKSEDGKFDLPVRVILPKNMKAGDKYPVLVSIYGGPLRSDVMNTWTMNGQQQYYAQEGLMQVIIDHRGSGHFGKEGSPYLYHNLGEWEIKDYITCIKWLIENKQADPTRVAITGFSYGGYLSALAVTLGAPHFTHAMAGGSVTHWGLYDSHYTERFMGTPQNNPEGYKKSSVMEYISKYQGGLQMIHGLRDENVHPQHTIRLATALQNANKQFDLMLYSGNRHGIRGKQGIHYNNYKTYFIYQHLLKKPVPEKMIRK